MSTSRTRRRVRAYRPIALALVVTLVCSLVPPASWRQAPGNNTAYASDVESLSPSFYPLHDVRGPSLNSLFLSELSVSRLQSAYTPAGLVSGTLVITYTITNHQPPAITPQVSEGATLTDVVRAMQSVDPARDPNTIRNVLLVNSPAPGVTFVSTFPKAGSFREGGQHTWNLGDIPPLGSLTVTLLVQAPAAITGITALDVGARAWGTLRNRPVNAGACQATLTPDTLGGQPMTEYLAPTVDADYRDEYIARLAGRLCPNPVAQAFQYVKTLGYEAYKGSLRGARGTEWSQAGNALDKSSLLVATLRANGVPARYRQGELGITRTQELILSMFPTQPSVVGYVPEGAEVSYPADNPQLRKEAHDHWWVEAYQDGAWVALDPSFSYAQPGQVFATPSPVPTGEGWGGGEIPDALRHKVTVTLKTERYEMLTYLMSGFTYAEPLSYTFTTAELVGQPLTLKHLVNTQHPPFGCMVDVICWKHHTYVPYLRVGDPQDGDSRNPWVIQGHAFWELLSSYPFGQTVVTAEWLIFDVRDADGNIKTYTREIADRIGIDRRNTELKIRGMLPELITSEVLEKFGPAAPSLVNALDNHTIYFNPSLMSAEYAAHVGENLLAAAPRVLEVQAVATGLPDIWNVLLRGTRPDISGALKLAEVAELTEDTTQAFNRVMGASFVAFSDAASRDLAETGLVRAYPDSPRITLVSMVISPTRVMTEAVPVQVMDLLYDSIRVIAYPGQVKGAEWVYRMTRGVNEAFLEKEVGERLTTPPPTFLLISSEEEKSEMKSAAGVLEAATAQRIPMLYVDAKRLEPLADAPISEQAKARIVQATQRGYNVLVPKRMVTWNGRQTIAWWQVDPKTGEVMDVGEAGTHFLVMDAAGGMLLMTYHEQRETLLKIYRRLLWKTAVVKTWSYFWMTALRDEAIGTPVGFSIMEQPTPPDHRDAYKAAFKNTKDYMTETLWPLLSKAMTATTLCFGQKDCEAEELKLW
ncbi:MAG: transglutaminase family protein [Thermoflexales bacterium]|nr:transglutaminase family protein [Thermoflexales bacterium]